MLVSVCSHFNLFLFLFAQGPERYTGLACPPSEAKRNRRAVEAPAQQSFFTPYSVKSDKKASSFVSAPLEATPVAGRKLRHKSKRPDDERASLGVRRSMRLRGQEAPAPATELPEESSRRESSVRRSVRLEKKQKQEQSEDEEMEEEEEEEEHQQDLNISLRTPPRVRERRQLRLAGDGFAAPAPMKKQAIVVAETPRSAQGGSVRITRSKSSLAPVDKEAEERREREEAEEREREKRAKQEKRDQAKRQKEEEEAAAEKLRLEAEELERKLKEKEKRDLAKKQKKEEEEEKRRQKEEEKEKQLQKDKREAAKKLKQEEEEKEKQLQKEKREAAKKAKEEEEEKRRAKEEAEEKKRAQKEKRELARKQKEEADEAKRRQKEEEEREREMRLQKEKREQQKREKEEEEEKKRLQKEKREQQKREEEERERKQKEKEALEKAQKQKKIAAKDEAAAAAAASLSIKSPRRPVGGKRIAQLLSKYEQSVSSPAPAQIVESSVPAPVPVAVSTLPQLSAEEGALLAARLDAIAVSALGCVSLAASKSRKRKTGVERAEAWSSQRSNTHSSLRDLLASHGIIRPDAGDETLQQALDAIPQVTSEIGDQEVASEKKVRVEEEEVASEKKPETIVVTAPALAAPAALAPIAKAPFAAFKSAALVEDSGVSDSGVSDSEDEEVPVKTTAAASASSVVAPGAQPLDKIQDRIAEIKRKFGASSAVVSEPVKVATPPPVIIAPAAGPTNLLFARLGGDGSPSDMNVSLNLASAFASVASNSPVEAQSMRVMSGGDESMLGLNQSDFAPGFLTVELQQPSASPAQKPLQKNNTTAQFGSFMMDGSFFNQGISDSEGYNTVDAERAQNAVQFLEQIQLNGNTSILHNVTLSTIAEAEEDEKDDDEGEVDSSPAEPAEQVMIGEGSNKSLREPAFVPVSELQQLQVLAQAGPTSLLQLPKLQQQQTAQQQTQSQPQQQGVKRSAEELLREANKGSKKQQTTTVSATTTAAPSATAAADKLLQAKQRRERLEEEERRRKEEQVKKTTERDQRARALKAAPAADAKPSKAAILEKSKRNAEMLVKSKVVEAGKKKLPIPGPTAVAPPAPLVAVSAPAPLSEKKGLFGAFKGLKAGGSKKMAPTSSSTAAAAAAAASEPKENSVNKEAPSPARSPGPRPSPLRKAVNGGPPSNVSPRIKSPEANATQYSISPMKESDAEDRASAAAQQKKREAKWAKKEALMASLQHQNLDLAEQVFGVPIGLTCNLAEVFGGYKRKNTYTQPRTSSAQWSDIPKGPFAATATKK